VVLRLTIVGLNCGAKGVFDGLYWLVVEFDFACFLFEKAVEWSDGCFVLIVVVIVIVVVVVIRRGLVVVFLILIRFISAAPSAVASIDFFFLHLNEMPHTRIKTGQENYKH